MPTLPPVWMCDRIWWHLSSRISARIAELGSMISPAMARPLPEALASSCWQNTPSSTKDSWVRIWFCWLAGNTSMMRLIVSTVEEVCRVAKVRWPVSARVRPASTVSRSRISPISTTSGSWRSTRLSDWWKPSVSVPTSRWLTRHILLRCTNSIGSSMVMMWSGRVWLIRSIIDASEVDLPEPVAPVTSTSPCDSPHSRVHTSIGRPSCSKLKIS